MFITNDSELNSFLSVFQKRARFCEEIKILVGYFYFSGIKELLNLLCKNPDLKLKILIGLEADVVNGQIIEFSRKSNASRTILKQQFFESIARIFNHGDFDDEQIYQNINAYIEFIENERIEIRKTAQPNHAKLYIFKMNPQSADLLNCFFVTGSSNLSLAGLKEQNEFNVCIRDFGIGETNEYFDTLWNNAIQFTDEETKRIIHILKHQTQLKQITPFEAYFYVLKTYLDSFRKKELSQSVKEKMESAGYKPYQYQLDAIGQALSILEEHNGVIIADVVGLGKSVIASAIAYELKKRGLVLAPPGLIGTDDKSTGWKKYLEDFGLAAMGWDAYSIGKLEQVREIVRNIKEIEVIIVDEAHRFRNQDTQSYDLLHEICRNKKVILLTATPFNNQPSDIFSLLKLFITPRKSTITLHPNIEAQFNHYGYVFEMLSYIKKNYMSSEPAKRQRAQTYFQLLFNRRSTPVDISMVNEMLKELSLEIKAVLSPVMIRRNRLDLQKHPDYKQDLNNLSEVQDPISGFYYLTPEQSSFYDSVINEYFIENGTFTGAIYMPFNYSTIQTSDFDKLFQTNLYYLMRRLLVKRFESSFGAFYETICKFIQIHEKVHNFIQKTDYYILDRDWINKISELDEEEFLNELVQKMIEIENSGERAKSRILYDVNTLSNKFLEDIKNDIALLRNIADKMHELDLHDNDPKATMVIEHLKKQLRNDPGRKIIIFSEYQATVRHLGKFIQNYDAQLYNRCLVVEGDISKQTYLKILQNFDASLPRSKQKHDYDVLICTDKLSEGYNLNRAGYIINYDIPWNPVRVIQRLGRINRIGQKVFDKLYIMNIFPTQQGEDVIQQRTIAENKMFMIHNSIGEDAKIFSPDETPSASELYVRLNTNPEHLDEESIYTRVYLEFSRLVQQYPDLLSHVSQLPPRIKTAKISTNNELITFIHKYNLYIIHTDYSTNTFQVKPFEFIWDKIKCEPSTSSVPLSASFWQFYQQAIQFEPHYVLKLSEQSILQKAFNKLQHLLNKFSNNSDVCEFLELLVLDLQNYGTLSDYRLRQIIELNSVEDIQALHKDLGQTYVQSLMQHFTDNRHIIIAIENQQPDLFHTKNNVL